MTWYEFLGAGFAAGAGWAAGTAAVRMLLWRYLWVVTVVCNFPGRAPRPTEPDVRDLHRR